MATAQKKKPTQKKSAASAKKNTVQHTAHPKPIRREVWAVVCLFLAIFSSFGYFKMEGVFINFLCTLIKGLLGYGFWLMPPAFLMGGYILAMHRGRPVCLRLWCTLLLPLSLSGLLHGIFAENLAWEAELLQALWQSGQLLHSGGVIGGTLAQLFVLLFTDLGSTILFAMAGILMLLAACNRTIFDLASWIFSRPKYDYEMQDEYEDEPVVQITQAPASTKTRRREIDIPIDEDEETSPAPMAKEQTKQKRGLFNRKPRVPAPDQLLSESGAQVQAAQNVQAEQDEQAAADTAFLTEPIFASAPLVSPEQLTAPETTAPLPQAKSADVMPQPQLPELEGLSKKMKRDELDQQTVQVAQDIQGALTQQSQPYQYPPLSLLKQGTGKIGGEAMAELNANRQRLTDTIRSFGIDANITNVTRGPSVTRYELELDQGVRLNKLTNLADDIALSLGASGVRIAPIPDQISMVGIEVPNKLVTPVNINAVIGDGAFQGSTSKVSFAVGKDIGGRAVVGDIAKMPHLLIAGTTGSGKSVCTNSLIISLLYKATPDEVRLIMVDPKMVELGIYNGIPHLLIPVVTDPKKAAGALQWAVCEMMKRYRLFSEAGVRDLATYNAMADKTQDMQRMPQVVVIIDELADLMLVAAKEVEESICRVAQMGRASGMHLIIATQRPSADVITGLMKANIPSRIAFAVASNLESRIILDTTGAEKLVGRGDMLYFPLGAGKATRVQGCLISDQEVASVVEFVKRSGAAHYDDQVMHEIEQHAAQKEKGNKGIGGSAPEDVGGDYDELIDAATEVIIETGQASVSMLQRRLKLGYARAARLVDQLEEKGIVGPFEGSKPRQLLVSKEQWQEMKYRQGTACAPTAQQVEQGQEQESDAPPFDTQSSSEHALDHAQEDIL